MKRPAHPVALILLPIAPVIRLKAIVMLMTIAVLIAISVPVVPVLAAPARQEQRPLIAQPEQDAAVRGVVQLVGTAVHPQFQRFEIYYAPFPVPSDQSWIFVGDAHYNQQPLGLLGTWDSRSVPDGTYVLRVRVVRQDGNYIDSDARRVLVANTRPVETPTPNVTETPSIPPTALPATPTIVIAVPTVDSAAFEVTPEPTAAVEAAPASEPILSGPTAAGSDSPGAGGSDVAALFDASGLFAVVRKTALYTLVLFATVGLFFGVKALLYWLWLKIKP